MLELVLGMMGSWQGYKTECNILLNTSGNALCVAPRVFSTNTQHATQREIHTDTHTHYDSLPGSPSHSLCLLTFFSHIPTGTRA